MNKFPIFYFLCFVPLFTSCVCEQEHESLTSNKTFEESEKRAIASIYRPVSLWNVLKVMDKFGDDRSAFGFSESEQCRAFPLSEDRVWEYGHLSQWQGIAILIIEKEKNGDLYHILYGFRKESKIPECIAIFKFIRNQWVAQDLSPELKATVTTPGNSEKAKVKQ